MKTPMSDKSPQMIAAIESLFPGTKQAIEDKCCPFCNSPIGAFKDAESIREYEISGMCQKCQDDVFGENSEYL